MEELFATLKMIPEMMEMLTEMKSQQSIEKRWLSVAEATQYLPYQKDTIYKKLDTVFIEGTHFYRQDGTIFMDRQAIDMWVMQEKASKINAKFIVKDLIS